MGLFDDALAGNQQALARVSTLIENDDPRALAMVDAVPAPEKAPRVIGITGPPGAGKSSLINLLIGELRATGERVAVLLVDPSSRTTGGAVLGDRVRMLAWGDPDVFVRSQATRGQEGGLAPSTATLVDFYGLAGYTTVVIETVGVGQDGIDIRQVCDTTVVVQTPHQGDSVQSLKAGILEIADIFVVSKADLPAAHQTVRDLNSMLHLADRQPETWTIPVVAVSATEGTGMSTLMLELGRHASFIESHPEAHTREASRRSWEITKRAVAAVQKSARGRSLPTGASRSELVARVLDEARASLD